jgi:hypothetical protein
MTHNSVLATRDHIAEPATGEGHGSPARVEPVGELGLQVCPPPVAEVELPEPVSGAQERFAAQIELGHSSSSPTADHALHRQPHVVDATPQVRDLSPGRTPDNRIAVTMRGFGDGRIRPWSRPRLDPAD